MLPCRWCLSAGLNDRLLVRKRLQIPPLRFAQNRPATRAIESCIINVLFQAQRKRTVLDEGAQQIFVVLQGARGVACQIRELINFVNGAIG